LRNVAQNLIKKFSYFINLDGLTVSSAL